MPSSNHKKKIKKVKITENVTIKAEPQDQFPLSYYVDDRIELIKQIFSILKSKTIKSISPILLQGKSIDAIQEQCLDEILGISKKRLLSIINATKCPSDTETSDSDSEIENIEEHISLDEISSDEDNIVSTSKKSNKRKGLKRTKTLFSNNEAAKKKDGPPNKEVSVLELLELQARARAIRSQLALEPVTKIELDSDQSSSSSSSSSSSESSKKKKINNKKKEKVIQPSTSKSIKEEVKKITVIPEKKPSQLIVTAPSNGTIKEETGHKRIRLKRNFRKRQTDDEDDNQVSVETTVAQDANTEKESEVAKPIEKLVEPDTNNDDVNNQDRSSSPEIITMVPSPETFCISDSEDESNKPKETIIEEKKIEEPPLPKEDPEEGEIVEDDEVIDDAQTEQKSNEVEENENLPTSIIAEETENVQSIDEPNTAKVMSTEAPIEESGKEVVEEKKSEEPDEVEINLEYQEDTLNVDLDKEDLDYEMKGSDSEDEDTNKKESETVEIIDSSNEEEEEKEVQEPIKKSDTNKKVMISFHDRWLDSKKVSKILATSRLGNRVRDNIKMRKNKIEQENLNKIELKQTAMPIVPSFSSEEGSVQHYEELISKIDN